jgi:hypothetical protein
MSTLNVENISDGADTIAAGYVVHGSAKVWVSFTPAGATAFDSFNVASLVDNGAGDTSVNFTNAMANGNYVQVSEAEHANAVQAADMTCRLRSRADRLAASTRLSTGDSDAVKNMELNDNWTSATAILGDLA